MIQAICDQMSTQELTTFMQTNHRSYANGQEVLNRRIKETYNALKPILKSMAHVPSTFFPEGLYPFITGTSDSPPSLVQLNQLEKIVFVLGTVELWLALEDVIQTDQLPPPNPENFMEYLETPQLFKAWFKRH